MTGADLGLAQLSGAMLVGADLSGAKGLSRNNLYNFVRGLMR
jgi:uncharacterized protein YjbI with pentapeptide repeats